MTAAHQNPPTQPKKVRVTPPQMASLAVLDVVSATIQQSAGVLGDSLGQTEAADILVGLAQALNAQKAALIERWTKSVIIAQPGDVPPAPVITSRG